MTLTEIRRHPRVWINCPSGLQPYHHLHGKTGIAIVEPWGWVRLHFTEGNIHSMVVNPLYLSKKF